MAEQKKKTAAVRGKSNNKSVSDSKSNKSSAKSASKSSGKGKSASTAKSGGNASVGNRESLRREIIMLAMVGAAVLLAVFLIGGNSENSGLLGGVMASVLYGIMGIGAWILPVMLVGGAVYLASEKDFDIFKIRVVLSVILFLTLITFVQALGGMERFEGLQPSDFVAETFKNGEMSNGGFLGALLYVGLHKLLGGVGTYIVLIMLFIMMVVLISGGSLIGAIRRAIDYAGDARDKYLDYYDEEYADFVEDDYDDFDDYDEPALVRQRPKVSKPAIEVEHKETQPRKAKSDKLLAVDIKKGNKKENKISLFTDELETEKKSGGMVDRSGYVEIPNIIKHSEPEDKVGTEENNIEAQPKQEDNYELKRLERVISEAKEAHDKNFATEQAKEEELENDLTFDLADEAELDTSLDRLLNSLDLEEVAEVKAEPTENNRTPEKDIPPWEETPYVGESEPQIFKAGETKLVDELNVEKKKTEYKFPKLEFLGTNNNKSTEKNREEILRKSKKLEDTLAIFKVEAKVNNISIGPTVTRYELTPSKGTKVSAVTNLENDIKFSMAAESIIIEAPIPGKSAIGIEIPNDTRESVYFSEVLRSEQFQQFKSKISFGLGKDITGSVTVADLAKMPHLLVAGTTGSGKSVCINTLIMSILYKATPDEVKMIMVDPKMVELSVYNGIPHLLLPVVTEPEKAAGALNWAVIEMERRYKLLAQTGTRNIEGYNQKVSKEEKLSQIVIIIDELADLMMVVGKEIETSICRLAQKARAAGMHLVLATQRPSADVLTGLIRSNVPSRIAFKVSGSMDSRIILDSTGAEKLLGKGDMLFKTADMSKPMRIQGAFITDDEVERVVSYIGSDNPEYDQSIINEIAKASITVTSGADGGEDDPLTDEVLDWIVANPKCASAGKVQRHFKIGFNRASRIIEDLEARGILGPSNGSQPREVYMDKYELKERKERYDSYDNY